MNTTPSRPRPLLAWLAALLLLAVAPAAADAPPRGALLQLTVHGAALEHNLLGFSPEREVNVYLPPGYAAEPQRRYPVLYILHGITDPLTVWTVPWRGQEAAYGAIQNLLDRGTGSGLLQPMIAVLVDARTPYFGCHYVNSPVKGHWQDFIADELVAHIDANYRTLARRDSRGVMGHSMGGYGALRLGLDRPDRFGAVYGLSPSLLGWGGDLGAANPAFALLASGADPAQHLADDFYVTAAIGVSQAFSPNPDKPPYFADYPFREGADGLEPNPAAHGRWEANFLANRIDAYLAQTERLLGLRFDAGYDDQFTHIPPTAREFSAALTRRGVAHDFELYNGDHRNRLWGRHGRLYTEVLPYFSRLLRADD